MSHLLILLAERSSQNGRENCLMVSTGFKNSSSSKGDNGRPTATTRLCRVPLFSSASLTQTAKASYAVELSGKRKEAPL
jgi:hypothetical protein